MTLTRARVLRATDATVRAHPGYAREAFGMRIVRRERLDAEAEAERIVAEARAAANVERRRAESAAAQERASAREQGYQEGLAQGAADVAIALAHEQQSHSAQTERLVQLATLLAERIVGRALKVDPEALRDMATVLLSEVRGARRIVFRCRPDDVAELERSIAELAAHAEIRIEANPQLGPGDFELSTDVGTLKGSVGARLELLARKLSVGLGQ